MIAHEVARKYARALFLSAKGKNLINQAHEQFVQLKEFAEGDSKLLEFLGAPQVLSENKVALVRTLFGNKIEALFVEFLVVLINKHRVSYLHEIIDELVLMVETEKGLAKATVVTAVTLTEDERRSVMEKLTLQTGLTVELEEQVDPNVIGGMIVTISNKVIDGSVRYGLDSLHEQLSRVRVH